MNKSKLLLFTFLLTVVYCSVGCVDRNNSFLYPTPSPSLPSPMSTSTDNNKSTIVFDEDPTDTKIITPTSTIFTQGTETVNPFNTVSAHEIQPSNIHLLREVFEITPPFVGEHIFWSPDGNWFGIYDINTLYLSTGDFDQSFVIDLPANFLNAIPIIHGDFLLAFNFQEESLKVWDPITNQFLYEFPWKGEYLIFTAFDAARKRFIMSGVKGDPDEAYRAVDIIDISNGEIVQTIRGYKNDGCYVEVSPDGTVLIISTCGRDSRNNQISVWDIDLGQLKYFLPNSYSNGAMIRLDHQGKFLAVMDNSLKLWMMQNQTWYDNFEIPLYSLTSPGIFSHDDKLILTIEEWGREIIIREITTGEKVFITEGEANNVLEAAFSPDGRLLAILESSGTVKLWGVK